MDISKKYKSRVVDYHRELGVDPGIPLGNMSMCRLADGNLLVSVRQFHYIMEIQSGRHIKYMNRFEKRTHFLAADKDMGFLGRIDCDPLRDYEDPRVMRYGNTIQVSITDISNGWNRTQIASFDFGLENGSMRHLRTTHFRFPGKEKNYVPVEDGMGVFISDLRYGSLNIVTTNRPDRKTSQSCSGCMPYRGSTPMLRWRDGYVALVHRCSRQNYINAFMFFDKSLRQCRISQEFTVFNNVSTVNFCCGMLLEDDKAVLPICVKDCTTHLFELPLQDFYKTAREHY